MRTGFVRDGFIEFDFSRREVEPTIMAKQGVLDAGNLHGLLATEGLLSEIELACLAENKVGDEQYVLLGKKVLKLICPVVKGFIATLRTNYGQYWLREFDLWDSRNETLGNYCKGLRLKWSLDDGNTWRDFVPDKPIAQLKMVIGGSHSRFFQYITEEDWRALGDTLRQGYEPSPAAITLARAHEYSDQGDLRHALIEGVSALELALYEFLRSRSQSSNVILDSAAAFWQMPLQTQITMVALSVGKASTRDVEHTVKAIKMRNDVIHEGWNPTENAKDELAGLLRTVSALLPGPRFRFPHLDSSNTLAPEEKWKTIPR